MKKLINPNILLKNLLDFFRKKNFMHIDEFQQIVGRSSEETELEDAFLMHEEVMKKIRKNQAKKENYFKFKSN